MKISQPWSWQYNRTSRASPETSTGSSAGPRNSEKPRLAMLYRVLLLHSGSSLGSTATQGATAMNYYSSFASNTPYIDTVSITPPYIRPVQADDLIPAVKPAWDIPTSGPLKHLGLKGGYDRRLRTTCPGIYGARWHSIVYPLLPALTKGRLD